MKCPKCQFENPTDTLYCGKCGTKLPSEEVSAPLTETLQTPIKELTTGSTFAGRYQVIEELGKGGMGKVYKAFDTEIKEKIALKLLKPEITADEKTIERFRNEIKMARKISHKNVCRMYHLTKEEGTHYITMEFVLGEDLKRLIRKVGKFSAQKTIAIAKQVCEGLAEAHRLGVVHRDLKPQNIMVDEEGNARIMDFGIARSLKEKGITGEGVMIGTPEYMSPEQAEGKEVDQRSDIYSLGVILYEMVTGRVPFEGDTPLSVAVKHKTETPKDPTEYNAQIPETLSRLILRCMEKDRAKRYQSAGEVRSELAKMEEEISTTEKVLRETRLEAKKPRKRIPYFIPAVLLIAVLILAGYFIYDNFIKSEKAAPEPIAEAEKRKMIVVLPFENLGSPEDVFFADGITDEITSRLAAVHELGVISRTSAVQYDRTGKMMKQIGQDLGVDYVLEGTVRWDRAAEGKSRTRVTAQLIHAPDDTHIWAGRYDRVIDDIFSVQTEIAEQIIQQLDINLLTPEQQALKREPTENLEAYQAYLRGMFYLTRPGWREEDYRLAIPMFELALKHDPNFVLAYVGLSKAHSQLVHYGYDRTDERISKAQEAAERALEIQPESPEAHQALGYYYYLCLKDYDRALKELMIAKKGLPNNTKIIDYIAYIWRRQGKIEESIDLLKQSFTLNPNSTAVLANIGVSYMMLRKHKEADIYYNRIISLAPDINAQYGLKARNYWIWNGALKEARAALEQIPNQKTDHSIYNWFQQELLERNYLAALERLSSATSKCIKDQNVLIPWDSLAGSVYTLLDKLELARASFDSARIYLEKEVKDWPDDYRIRRSLGIAYAGLGRKEEAIREGKLGMQLYPVSKDSLVGPWGVIDLARIYVMVEEYDAALDLIEYLLSIPSPLSVSILKLDPRWDPLRDHPKFKRILEKYSKK